MAAAKMIDLIRKAGVVGAGGAGFPTHVKLDAEVDTIIANGAECEPMLEVDQQLMKHKSKEFIIALEESRKLLSAERAVIALKSKYKEAITSIKKIIEDYDQIEIFEMGNFYPAGDEQQIVYEVTGKIIPEGGIPLMVNTVVINIETLLNVYQALNSISLTQKYLTVNGEVNNPQTLKVPLGTPLKKIIELAGGAKVSDYKLIDGGPMMGKLVSEDDSVTKTTKGILVLPADHKLIIDRSVPIENDIRRSIAVCCQCRACTDVCPRNLLGHSLEPHIIMRGVAYGIDTDQDIFTQADLCCECGACDTWGCPMGLHPRRIIIEVKKQLAKNGYKRENNQEVEAVHSMYEIRKIPVERLVSRLGIREYKSHLPFSEKEINVDKIELPLQQHIGAPAESVVQLGDSVIAGDLIAKIKTDSLGANLHAAIDGTIKLLGESIVIER
jgi:Na+-translocating ferredoxin:NAD+ oxidoreductase RnfC subunit